MKRRAHTSRFLLLALPWLALTTPARTTGAQAPAAPSRLVLVGTTDLRGETSPCGCHTPRGGFGRIGGFVDSLRRASEPMLYVDAGGALPDLSHRQDLAEFMFAALGDLGPSAVGVSPRDLRFGLSTLRRLARETGVPVTCANLVDAKNRAPLFPTTRLVDVGPLKVGLFALIGERFDLGAARDSVLVLDPERAAQEAVASLRGRGAQVVVLLSQLGRVGGEDIAAAVDGIDAVFLGHDIPILEKGRRVGNTLASYAGERGQHVGLVRLELGPGGHVSDGSCEVRALGPEVREQRELLAKVKGFEDAYNERMRREQRAAQVAEDADSDPVDHFVGGAVCARCHTPEAEQWLTTAHSLAWETLVREKKDATPECVPCHVVGYRQPGGFQAASATPHLVNVQCENCHGMGTKHSEDWVASGALSEATCRSCHNAERDPEFDYATRLPLIAHGNTSGESIRIVKARREKNYPTPGH